MQQVIVDNIPTLVTKERKIVEKEERKEKTDNAKFEK